MYLICFQKPCSQLECCRLLLGWWWWLMWCIASQCSKQMGNTEGNVLHRLCAVWIVCLDLILHIDLPIFFFFFSCSFYLGLFSLNIQCVETGELKPKTSLYSKRESGLHLIPWVQRLDGTCRNNQRLGERNDEIRSFLPEEPSSGRSFWENMWLRWVRLKIFTG